MVHEFSDEPYEDTPLSALHPKIQQAMKEYAELRELKRRLEGELSMTKGKIEELGKTIYRSLDAAGMTSARVQGLGTFIGTARDYWRVENVEEFERWCTANEVPVRAFLMFSTNKLGSFCREAETTNQPLPAGVTKFTKEGCSLRKD